MVQHIKDLISLSLCSPSNANPPIRSQQSHILRHEVQAYDIIWQAREDDFFQGSGRSIWIFEFLHGLRKIRPENLDPLFKLPLGPGVAETVRVAYMDLQKIELQGFETGKKLDDLQRLLAIAYECRAVEGGEPQMNVCGILWESNIMITRTGRRRRLGLAFGPSMAISNIIAAQEVVTYCLGLRVHECIAAIEQMEPFFVKELAGEDHARVDLMLAIILAFD